MVVTLLQRSLVHKYAQGRFDGLKSLRVVVGKFTYVCGSVDTFVSDATCFEVEIDGSA